MSMQVFMSIGETVKAVRKKRKFTMSELADVAGLTQSTVSRIESEQIDPTRKTLIALARALNDDLGQDWLRGFLMGGESPKSKKEIAEEMTASELIGYKFGGGSGRRTSKEAEMLAKLLDAEIERMEKQGR